MNTLLCEKCGATIPLREADTGEEAAPRSDYSCNICSPPDAAKGKKKGCSRFLHILGIAVFALFGFGLQRCSFEKVAEIRQLARVPQTDVQAAVPGEVNLRGKAVALTADQKLLEAPRSKKTCLYYRYLVEREETDSDGDKSWVTVSDDSKFVERFKLRDGTGEIVVRPSRRAAFKVGSSDSWREGDRRYTEYRLDPGDAIFLFGYAESEGAAEAGGGGAMFVGFDKEGDYRPIISEKTELAERKGGATGAIIFCWVGLVMIGIATLLLFSLSGRHRLLVYFWLLCVTVGGVLVYSGVGMMRSDLRAAHEHISRQAESVRGVVAGALKEAGIEWDGEWSTLGDVARMEDLDEAKQARLRRARIDFVAATRRVGVQARKFPYNLLRGTLDLDVLPEVNLPPADEEMLDQLETKFEKAKLSGFAPWIFGLLALLVGGLATLFGFRSVKRKRMSENLATSPTSGVAYGLTEHQGVIDLPEGVDPLSGPLSSQPSVYYDYRVSRKHGHGKNAKWVEVHHEERRCRFLCRDREGTIPVDPEGAKMLTWRKKSKRSGRMRYVEQRLQFGDPLYAIGVTEIDPSTGDSLRLCKSDNKEEPFVLSSFTEEAVVAKLGVRAIGWLTAAFAGVLLAGLLMFASWGAFGPADFLAAAFIGPAYMFALTLVLHYNDLVFLRQRARRDWHNIEVSLKKRHDLVPSMVEAAKAYMAHEGGLMERIASLRGGYGGGAVLTPGAAGQLLEEGNSVGLAFAGLVEDNPDLKASTQTSLVIRELVALEDEIAFMRAGYNNAVAQYNTRIASVPDVIFAKAGGFKPMELLTYDAKLIPMPEIAAETWRRQQAVETAALPAAAGEEDTWTSVPLPLPDPEAPVIDAAAQRVLLYASLLDAVGEPRVKQLEILAARAGQEMADAVAAKVDAVQAVDPWTRLSRARELMPELRGMSMDAYRQFKGMARLLIESDARISIYEFAFEKALGFLVDPVFDVPATPEVRYRSVADEPLPAEIAVLSDYITDPSKHENLGPYDAALGEALHATAAVRGEIYATCYGVAFEGGDETQRVRYVLLQALSDALFIQP
jgi:hypothetical protein